MFDLDAAHTARFKACMGTGVIVGTLAGGLWLIPRFGKPRITAVVCGLQAGGFALLADASLTGRASWLPAAILLLGVGFFTVGGVSLMIDMTFTDVHR